MPLYRARVRPAECFPKGDRAVDGDLPENVIGDRSCVRPEAEESGVLPREHVLEASEILEVGVLDLGQLRRSDAGRPTAERGHRTDPRLG
jgi:hypothetical protein